MENESLLSRFLEKEKSVKPSSSLEEQVMAQIGRIPSDSVRLRRPSIWIQVTTIAACAVIAIAVGISTGKNSPVPTTAPTSWNINDSQIENLALYETDNN